jgi:transaldolase
VTEELGTLGIELSIKVLAAPFTVDTMPEGALKASADHDAIGTILPADGDCEEIPDQFAKAGIHVNEVNEVAA